MKSNLFESNTNMLSREKLQGLTGVKGYLALIIVLYHRMPDYDFYLAHLVKDYGGFLGNYLFFLTSGFLTMYHLSNSGLPNFRVFFGKKIRKLWPAYAIMNILQALVMAEKNGIDSINPLEVVLILLMQGGGTLTDIYPYIITGWFFCALMVCYFVCYGAVFISQKWLVNRRILFSLLAIWGYILETHYWNYPFCYNHTGEGFLNFFIGCLFFELYNMVSKYKKYVYAVLAVIMGLVFLLPKEVLGDIRMIITFVICPAIILLSIEVKWIKNFFTTKVSLILGNMCMYLCLIHPFILLKDFKPFDSRTGNFVLYFINLIIISLVVMNMIEFSKRRITELNNQ